MKTVSISDEVWRELMRRKLDSGKSLGEVIRDGMNLKGETPFNPPVEVKPRRVTYTEEKAEIENAINERPFTGSNFK